MNILLYRSLLLSACIILSLSNARAAVFTDELIEEAEFSSSFDDIDEEINERIKSVVSIVEPRYNNSVKSYLRIYLEANPARTEEMLGRIEYYFPMFEELLARHNMPEDLKYLAIVESALNPHAASHAGAVGLWQFMKPTAREMGLNITKYIDERRDPEKSTVAAIEYLSKLYNRFGDWALAMAAYNAGPGRVSYAVRKAGSTDFDKVMRYLPRETRAYVPGFIAASYLVNFYQEHQLTPTFMGLDFYDTEYVRIHKGLDFTEIQHITGVHMDVIRRLNPRFLRNYIPGSVDGHDIVLPRYALPALQAYLDVPDSDALAASAPSFHEMLPESALRYEMRPVVDWYQVKNGDNLYKIGLRAECSVDELMNWNGLHNSNIAIGQNLKIVKMKRVLVGPPVRTGYQTQTLETPVRLLYYRMDSDMPQLLSAPQLPAQKGIRGSYIRIERRQSLVSLMQQKAITQEQAMAVSSNVGPGTVIHLQSQD